MFFEDENDIEDSFDEELQILQEDELTRYINSSFRKLTREDIINLQLDVIEKYFPGIKNLSDDELIRQKYFRSLHQFQYHVAVKRMFEITGRGSAIPDIYGWNFVIAGNGI